MGCIKKQSPSPYPKGTRYSLMRAVMVLRKAMWVMQGIINADKAIKGALGLVVPFGAEVPNVAPGTEQGQSARAIHNIGGQAPMPQ